MMGCGGHRAFIREANLRIWLQATNYLHRAFHFLLVKTLSKSGRLPNTREVGVGRWRKGEYVGGWTEEVVDEDLE